VPLYTLKTFTNGVLTNTPYTLQITGSAASNVNVKYSTSSSGPWTDFSGTPSFVPGDGQGSPAAPQDGDQLTLTGTVGPSGTASSYTLSGTCTYEAGDGYVRGGGLAGDEADWAASGN
jgi:hypothetical protein